MSYEFGILDGPTWWSLTLTDYQDILRRKQVTLILEINRGVGASEVKGTSSAQTMTSKSASGRYSYTFRSNGRKIPYSISRMTSIKTRAQAQAFSN